MSPKKLAEEKILQRLNAAAAQNNVDLTYAHKQFFFRLLNLTNYQDQENWVKMSHKELTQAVNMPSRTVIQSLNRLTACGAITRQSSLINTSSHRPVFKPSEKTITYINSELFIIEEGFN